MLQKILGELETGRPSPSVTVKRRWPRNRTLANWLLRTFWWLRSLLVEEIAAESCRDRDWPKREKSFELGRYFFLLADAGGRRRRAAAAGAAMLGVTEASPLFQSGDLFVAHFFVCGSFAFVLCFS